MSDDPVVARVAEAIALGQAGDRDRARDELEALWLEVGELGNPVHRCGIAHSLADLQDDPRSELTWDQRALDVAESATDEDVELTGMTAGVAGLLPSLHLNLADVHRRLGNMDRARSHLASSRSALGPLPTDGYTAMIGEALARVADAIDRDDTSPSPHAPGAR